VAAGRSEDIHGRPAFPSQFEASDQPASRGDGRAQYLVEAVESHPVVPDRAWSCFDFLSASHRAPPLGKHAAFKSNLSPAAKIKANQGNQASKIFTQP
jgi:hypothetical protein